MASRFTSLTVRRWGDSITSGWAPSSLVLVQAASQLTGVRRYIFTELAICCDRCFTVQSSAGIGSIGDRYTAGTTVERLLLRVGEKSGFGRNADCAECFKLGRARCCE